MQSNVKIHLYTFSGTATTVLTQKNYEGLVYETEINNDGYCEFTCRADDEMITPDTIKMYTRVKIYEGSECVFFGFINDNQYDLQTVKVKAVSISAILKDKLASGFTAGASYATVIGQLITAMNSVGNTGITLGTISMSGTVSKTYTGSETVEYVIKDLIGTNQLYITPDGVLNVAPLLGTDLSGSLVFKYDVRQIEASNLLNFSVKESGQNIATRVLAKDNSSHSTLVSDTALQAEFGVLDTVVTYYSVSGVPALTTEGLRDIRGSAFTPDVQLSPKIGDTFDVGDTVSVKIYNKFVNIDTQYQILQKTVSYIGTEKQIKIKLNDNSKDFLDYIKAQDKRITQLQNN